MKRFIFLLMIIVLVSKIVANEHEGMIRAIRIVNGIETLISVKVKVFTKGETTSWEPLIVNDTLCEGLTNTTNYYNGFFSVEGISGTPPIGELFPAIPYDIAVDTVVIAIGNVYFRWWNEDGGDSQITYNETAGTVRVIKSGCGFDRTYNNIYREYTINVKNTFDGGLIQFNNNSPDTIPSGNYLTKEFNEFNSGISITALPNQDAACYYLWNNWSIDGSTDYTYYLSYSDLTTIANYDPAERLVFTGTTATISSVTYSENEAIKKKVGTQISISINDKIMNSLLYTLDTLKKNGVYYSQNGSFSYTPLTQTTTTFAAILKLVKPVNNYRNQYYSTTVGQPITIYWNEHPSAGVTAYQIWRRIKDVQSSTLLATVNRGTTSYVDYECTYTDSYTANLIYYDIRAYYQPNGSYADADYIAVYGDYDLSNRTSGGNKVTVQASSVIPAEYKLSNYPNPFNPTTVIKYTMPEAGQVILKVYNMIGQEVKTLVNSMESAGIHTVNFNANGLPTGIYVARIQAGAKVMSLKLQLVK